MKTNESIRSLGIVNINVFEVKNGIYTLKDHFEDNNLVVDVGLEKLCLLLGNSGSSNYISKIGYGTDNTAVSSSDTTLSDLFSKAVDGVTFPITEAVEFEFDLELVENNGVTIREYGLICDDDTLFSRIVIGSIAKEDNIYISGTWRIKFVPKGE